MAKKYIIIHMDTKLQVFDADTERKQLLDRVMHYTKGKETLSDPDLDMLSKLADGRFDEVFSLRNGCIQPKHLQNVTLYWGVNGPDPLK